MNALNGFKPLLAAPLEDADIGRVQWPVLASPKIDGIRCIIHPTLGPVTRTLKPIPNNYIRDFLSVAMFRYLDGEIVVGEDPYIHGIFNATQSAVMSAGGTPKFRYLVFDTIPDGLNCPFHTRTTIAREIVERANVPEVQYLVHDPILGPQDLAEYEEEWVSRGAEGVMLRHPHGKYKFNRSTLKEGILLKVKRFVDDEAVIIGYEPLYRNENEATRDARGFQKRSSHLAGMVEDDTRIGKFHLRGITGKWKDVTFHCGSGLTDTQRVEYRGKIDSLIGKVVSYKYQPHGAQDKPRAPIFKGLRYD